jgi:uncharacterized membrane protein YhhN
MTPAAVALVAAFLVAAAADWGAVAAREHGRPALPRRTRWLTKPLPMILLIAAALALDPADPAVRAWFVAGLALSLAGDVALLSERAFVAGLAAFLLAHVAYTAGFVAGGLAVPALAVGAVAIASCDVVMGRRLVRALRGGRRSRLVAPVAAYMLAISAMVATAAGSLNAAAIAGAVLFAASDTLLAEGRFIRPVRGGGLAVMVMYHLGQGLLVISLAFPAR